MLKMPIDCINFAFSKSIPESFFCFWILFDILGNERKRCRACIIFAQVFAVCISGLSQDHMQHTVLCLKSELVLEKMVFSVLKEDMKSF